MPKVNRDDLGLWIDHGYGAIRPSAPSRLEEGEAVDLRHFGGSTLYGVGKMEGRGRYREAWMSAPEPREIYDSKESKRLRAQIGEGSVDFDFGWECYLRDLAVLERGNPHREINAHAGEDISALKRGREAYMAGIGYLLGLLGMKDELNARGSDLAALMRSLLESRDLQASAAAPDKGRDRPAGMRI